MQEFDKYEFINHASTLLSDHAITFIDDFNNESVEFDVGGDANGLADMVFGVASSDLRLTKGGITKKCSVWNYPDDVKQCMVAHISDAEVEN